LRAFQKDLILLRVEERVVGWVGLQCATCFVEMEERPVRGEKDVTGECL